MNIIERKQLKNHIERILRVPGNYQGGILEMAIVIDMSMTGEEASNRAKDLVTMLKSHSEVFRNVRLNTILWKGEEEFIQGVTPLAMLQMGGFFEKYEFHPAKKNWDGLLATLKKFYARSKLIIVLTNIDAINIAKEATDKPVIPVANISEARESMQPFLNKKIMVVAYDSNNGFNIESENKVHSEDMQSDRITIKSGTEIFMSLIR